MAEFAWFGGVDFSGAREPLTNLWTAIGRREGDRILITSLRAHAFRQDLCAFVADGWRAAVASGEDDAVLWGANFPFGIAGRSAAHIGDGNGHEPAWAEVVAWVADRPVEALIEAVPETSRGFRATDFGGAMSPFDTRTIKQTVAGLHWLQQLRDAADVTIHPQMGTAPGPISLIEVFPAGAARELGLPRRRSPSRPGEVRARAAALRTFVLFDHPDQEALAVTIEDAWDAVLACICASLASDDLDQPFRCTDHPRQMIELEGWIYRPPATLG